MDYVIEREKDSYCPSFLFKGELLLKWTVIVPRFFLKANF